jgi:hypothetical protein
MPAAGWIPPVLAAATLFTSSCRALPAVRGYYTPKEAYRNAPELVGQTITMRGKVEIVAGMCTEQACGDNPCCNYCGYTLGFPIHEFQKIYFPGKGAACIGDDCHSGCETILENRWYEVTGRVWKDRGGIYYLELADWKLME